MAYSLLDEEINIFYEFSYSIDTFSSSESYYIIFHEISDSYCSLSTIQKSSIPCTKLDACNYNHNNDIPVKHNFYIFLHGLLEISNLIFNHSSLPSSIGDRVWNAYTNNHFLFDIYRIFKSNNKFFYSSSSRNLAWAFYCSQSCSSAYDASNDTVDFCNFTYIQNSAFLLNCALVNS